MFPTLFEISFPGLFKDFSRSTSRFSGTIICSKNVSIAFIMIYSNIILYVFVKLSGIFSGPKIYLSIFQVSQVFQVHGNPAEVSNSVLSVWKIILPKRLNQHYTV